jgi:ribosomal protein L19E
MVAKCDCGDPKCVNAIKMYVENGKAHIWIENNFGHDILMYMNKKELKKLIEEAEMTLSEIKKKKRIRM